MIDSELTNSTSGASTTQARIVSPWRLLTVSPASGSLIATTRATAASSVLPIAPQRGSSIDLEQEEVREQQHEQAVVAVGQAEGSLPHCSRP